MRSNAADIVRQANELVATERAKVVTQLLKTFDPSGEDVGDFQAAWTDELNQREREIESGAVELVDWEELRASLTR